MCSPIKIATGIDMKKNWETKFQGALWVWKVSLIYHLDECLVHEADVMFYARRGGEKREEGGHE